MQIRLLFAIHIVGRNGEIVNGKQRGAASDAGFLGDCL
jgi:hypothetical protein